MTCAYIVPIFSVVANSKYKRDTDRRRPKGTGSVQELAPGKYRLRVFIGSDPVTGSPRQVTRVVQAKTQRQAQKLLDRLLGSPMTAVGVGLPVVEPAVVSAATSEHVPL